MSSEGCPLELSSRSPSTGMFSLSGEGNCSMLPQVIAVQSRTRLENRCKTTQNVHWRENWTTDWDKDGEFSLQLWNQFTSHTWPEFQLYWGGLWHAGPLIPSLSASSHKTGTQFDAFFDEALKACPCLLQLASNIHTKWITDGILKGKVSMSRNASIHIFNEDFNASCLPNL